MQRKKKPEPTLIAHDGSEIKRRFKVLYWFDGRLKEPSPWTRGFPKEEDGGIRGAGHLVMSGRCTKVQLVDRVRGRTEWTVAKGERIPGTHLYQPIVTRGDPEAVPRRASDAQRKAG